MTARDDVFSGRVRAIVIAIAMLSIVATIGSLVFGRQLAPPPAQPRDSYGHGALGHRAFVETLRELGVRVERWTLPSYDGVDAPLFVIEPNAPQIMIEGRAHSLGDLVRARMSASRVTVVVLPKWEPAMIGMVDLAPHREVHDLLASLPISLALVRAEGSEHETLEAREPEGVMRALDLRGPQRVTGGEAVLSDERGSFVVRDAKSLLYVVADPDLIHSSSLQRADHAAFWADFVRTRLGADVIVIDEAFHGAIETRSLAELFASWPGVLALGHVGLIVLVIVAMGRRRFGPPAPLPEALGRGPREVIEVAASVLANGTRMPRLAVRYVEHLVGDLHRRLGLSEAKTLELRAELVDEAAKRRLVPPGAVALLARARAIEATRRNGEAMSVAREAAAFRARMIGRSTSPRTSRSKEDPA